MALENLTQITSIGISTGITFSGVTTHTGTIKGTDADFTGNVSVGGTLTYEDVKNIDSVGIITARGGIFLPDNKKVQLGNVAGTADFEIAHDTTNTVLQNRTGALYLKGIGGSGNNIIIEAKNNENSARFLPDGACELYFNNAKTLETAVNQLTLTGNASECNLQFKTSDGNQRAFLGVTNGNAVTFFNATSEKIWDYTNNGPINLYYDNGKRFETTSDGIQITGRNYSSGDYAYFATSSTSTASVTIKKTAGGADSIDYLQLRNNANDLKLKISGDGIIYTPDVLASHEGDTNTKIRFPAADTFSVETGGTQRLRINSDGDIWQGSTTSSTARFAIQGSSSSTSATHVDTNGASLILSNTDTTNNNWQGVEFSDRTDSGDFITGMLSQCTDHSQNYGDLTFWTNSAGGRTEKLRITSTGLVGINKSPSTAQLVVKNSDDANRNSIDVYNDNGNCSSSLSQDSSGSGSFLLKNNSGTIKTFIKSYGDSYFTGGKVNIGAASPTASENGQFNCYTTTSSGKAQFVHDAGTGGLRLAGTGSGSGANLVFSNNYNSGTFSDHWTLTHNGGDDSFRFLIGGTGGTEAFRIKSDGTHTINTPMVYAYAPATTQSLTDATWTKNTWLTVEDIDTDGAFSSSRFTVPANKAGTYYVSVGANLYGNDNNIRNARVAIYKNGSQYARAHSIVNSTSTTAYFHLRHIQCVHSCIMTLAVGDYIENYMYLDVNSGLLYMSSDNDTVRANFLMVYRIG